MRFRTWLAISLVATLELLAACGDGSPPNSNNAPTRSLLIAPLMQGEYYCDDAVNNPNVQTEDDAALFCAAEGKNAADRITATLDALGPPSSPSAKYQLGYTLEIPAFRYFRKTNGQWVFDGSSLSKNLTTISDVDRPVVVFISGDHFVDSNTTLAADLASDPRNLMWDRDGPLVPNAYFTNPVAAWTLVDQSAPVNTMRRAAFGAVLSALCALPAGAQAKIAGVGILGEINELIPDLAGGAGFGVPMYDSTDYAPLAVSEFRDWLTQGFGTIEALDAAIGRTFTSFSSINPPSKDIFTEQATSYLDHIDAAAAGNVTVYGWLYDALGRDLSVSVYLDGVPAGVAETGLSRTDVTDAIPSIANPNVGFRLKLDYRSFAYGIHTLEVFVSAAGGELLRVAKQPLPIVDPQRNPPSQIDYVPVSALPLSADPNISGHLDGPLSGQPVLYNPLAALWIEFRNKVVRDFVTQFAAMATSSCLGRSKVFAHQIPAVLYSWNTDLLAADASLRLNDAYNPGVTLYGGTAFGNTFLALKERLHWGRYSVGEMHPSVPLTPSQYLSMFEMHRTNGAVFVAPYYLSALATSAQSGSGLSGFLISPSNQTYGSDLYYRAIQAVMSQ